MNKKQLATVENVKPRNSRVNYAWQVEHYPTMHGARAAQELKQSRKWSKARGKAYGRYIAAYRQICPSNYRLTFDGYQLCSYSPEGYGSQVCVCSSYIGSDAIVKVVTVPNYFGKDYRLWAIDVSYPSNRGGMLDCTTFKAQ